ncbi:TPA: hypothetical protein HA235_03845 [Candidatus Woesearchaeota archaeon]|nr:hypothetical protein [uncultured archaeon]MBS3173309.1 hypothetical protein [Candidatus Woesearchaeota archaeon]HIH31815.1 hypothetical protein [Candidatus Woesearchaeota archaeon]HIH55470.1 hypothetical protein [Candidatus Woesearchaeota archaeon]HIJ01888.1 hypothetical protein [Candidatus Woesearchaeota archaeon]
MEQTNIIPIIEYLKTNPREIEYNNEKLREALKDVIFCDDAFATDLQKDYENNENAFKNIVYKDNFILKISLGKILRFSNIGNYQPSFMDKHRHKREFHKGRLPYGLILDDLIQDPTIVQSMADSPSKYSLLGKIEVIEIDTSNPEKSYLYISKKPVLTICGADDNYIRKWEDKHTYHFRDKDNIFSKKKLVIETN